MASAAKFLHAQEKGLQGVESAQQQIGGEKFHGARIDRQAGKQRVPEREAGYVYIDAVGHSQKGKPGKDGNGHGEGCLQSGQPLGFAGQGGFLLGINMHKYSASCKKYNPCGIPGKR